MPTIRKYKPDDLQAMVALDAICFEEKFLFGAEAMRRFAEGAGAVTLVADADHGDGIAGFVIAQQTRRAGTRVGYCITIDVAPEFRGSSLGRALLEAAEERVRSMGASAMHLHVYTGNAKAIGFYERLGYIPGRRVSGFYGRAGLDAMEYSKVLAPAAK